MIIPENKRNDSTLRQVIKKPEVRTATDGPVIDQSQHAKSVSHIKKGIYAMFIFVR